MSSAIERCCSDFSGDCQNVRHFKCWIGYIYIYIRTSIQRNDYHKHKKKKKNRTNDEKKKRIKRKRTDKKEKKRNEEKIFVRYDYIFLHISTSHFENQDQNRSQNVFCPDEDDADDRCVDCNGIGV